MCPVYAAQLEFTSIVRILVCDPLLAMRFYSQINGACAEVLWCVWLMSVAPSPFCRLHITSERRMI
jgi:hypothetical protein